MCGSAHAGLACSWLVLGVSALSPAPACYRGDCRAVTPRGEALLMSTGAAMVSV